MEELARFRQEWLDELQLRKAKPNNLTTDPPTALTIYRQAVEHEQHGQLDDALVLYRQAFRMVQAPSCRQHNFLIRNRMLMLIVHITERSCYSLLGLHSKVPKARARLQLIA